MPEPKTPRHRLQSAWTWLANVDGPLGQRVARGGVWLLAADILTRLSSAIRMIALSRLLAPSDFGLLGIALMIQTWIEAFSGTGIQASLIHHKGDIKHLLDSAWTVGILRAVGIFLLMTTVAPTASRFFGDPNITPVVIAAGVVPVIWSLANPLVVSFRRDLDFRREVIYRTWGTAVGLLVAIVLGFALRNVWALVVSLIAARVAEVVGSYWVKPYKPRLRLQFSQVRQLFRYGKWIFWVNMLVLVQRQIDSVVIGKLLGTSQLGFYQVGRQLVRSPLEGLGLQLRSLLFPAFSRTEQARVAVGFVQTTRALTAVLLPLTAGFYFYAYSIVPLLLGERWALTSSVASILVWVGFIEVVAAPAASACMAIGRPGLLLPPAIVRLLTTVVGFVVLLPEHGVFGAALAYFLGSAAWCAILLIALLKTSLLQPVQIFSLPAKAFLVTLPLALVWAAGPKELGISGLAGWAVLSALASLWGAWLCKQDWLPHVASRSANSAVNESGHVG